MLANLLPRFSIERSDVQHFSPFRLRRALAKVDCEQRRAMLNCSNPTIQSAPPCVFLVCEWARIHTGSFVFARERNSPAASVLALTYFRLSARAQHKADVWEWLINRTIWMRSRATWKRRPRTISAAKHLPRITLRIKALQRKVFNQPQERALCEILAVIARKLTLPWVPCPRRWAAGNGSGWMDYINYWC